jgi:hypothetical protein
MQPLYQRSPIQIEFVGVEGHLTCIGKLQVRTLMSVFSPRSIAASAFGKVRRLLQRLRDLRSDGENPYSPAASLALLLAVGVAVKFVH